MVTKNVYGVRIRKFRKLVRPNFVRQKGFSKLIKFIAFSISGYPSGHVPAPPPHLHEARGKIVSPKLERVFQNLHRKSPEKV